MSETPQFLPPRGPEDIFPGDPCEAFPYLNSLKETGFILETGPPWPLPSFPLEHRAGEFAVGCVLRFDRGWELRDISASRLRVPSWRVTGVASPIAEAAHAIGVLKGIAASERDARRDLLPAEFESLRTIATGASPEAEACLQIIRRLTGIEILPWDAPATGPVCPSCGSRNVATTLLGFIHGPNPNTLHCPACDTRWPAAEERR